MAGSAPSQTHCIFSVSNNLTLLCRWSGLLPRQLRAATAPAALGLRAVRGATWAAAILLTAIAARESAFSLVDAGFLAAHQ